MYRDARIRVALVALAMIVACGRADAPTTVSESTPARISAVQGTGQNVYVGATAPIPLAVRVTGADNKGVPNVPVNWSVVTGAGDLDLASNGGTFAFTDSLGYAFVSFRPTDPGLHTVSASTPGLPSAVATWLVVARRVPNVVIRMDVSFDCDGATAFKGPDGSSDVTVHVGDVVEWAYGDGPATNGFTCVAQFRSTSVPAGGNAIDAALALGERFQFVPNVAGTWAYQDVLYSTVKGTLTARAP
ncbi:MAG: hypothetical protein ABJE47_19695 [bacterium]